MATKTYKDTTTAKSVFNDGDVLVIQDASGTDLASMKKVTMADLINGYALDKTTNVATLFSTSATYTVGAFCIYNGALYRCTTAITTAGAWDSTKWTQTKTTDELATITGSLATKESTTNKVTSFQTTPDNNHYPSEKLVKDSLDDKVSYQDIVDDLTTGGTTKALSAEQGKQLATDKVDYQDIVSTTGSATNKAISQNKYTTDMANKDSQIASLTRTNNIQNADIENMKAKMNGVLYNEIDVEYPSQTYDKGTIPASPAPNGEIVKIKGKSVAWNQLVDTNTTSVTPINGNKYFTNISGTKSIITSDGTAIAVTGGTDTVVNLTLLYNGNANVPTTTAQVLSDYPELNNYCAYDTGSLKNSTITEVISKGVNLWDETSNSKLLDITQDMLGKTYYLCVFNKPQSATASVVWKIAKSEGGVNIWYRISLQATVTITQVMIDAGSLFIFSDGDYHNFTLQELKDAQLQLCLDSVPDKTTYHPYKKTVHPLPATFTGRSAGTVADTYNAETGVVNRNIGMVDLGTLNWTRTEGGTGVYFFSAVISNLSTTSAPQCLCQKYSYSGRGTASAIASGIDKTLYTYSSSSQVRVRDDSYTDATDFKIAMNGVELYYELAEPTTEYLGIDDDPYIDVEGSGTVSLTHTETPAVESRFTMKYLIDLEAI